MELNTAKDAFDRITKKQKLSSCKSQEVIEQLGLEIENTLSKLKSSQLDHNLILTELKIKLNEIAPLIQIEGTQKEVNIFLSKYPKFLEKMFNPDISKAYRNVDFDAHTVNLIVANHFYREGMFDLSNCFVNEAKVTESDALRASFMEMYEILNAMKSRNLDPALTWVAANCNKLKQNRSSLDLKLHRLQFVEILQNSGRDEALIYARTFLAPFASDHMSEVQKLMACLLWVGRLDISPYSQLLSPTHWDDLTDEVTRQFCHILGQSFESPLSVTVSAGVQGLPTLVKLMTVMMGKKQEEWQSMKQLPVPVDLDTEFQFHSVFVCPVSREQASEENPPMLLSCGHVLCKQSITKLSKNNSTRPFKCPYCPSEVEVSRCKQLYL